MLKNVGNICAACEVDSLSPSKMFKRKGGIWFLIGVVGILLLVKFVFMRKGEPELEETYMHEVGSCSVVNTLPTSREEKKGVSLHFQMEILGSVTQRLLKS